MTFVLLCFKTILAKPLLKVLSMFVVSVISQAGMLDRMLVENVRNAWGGGVVDWLAPKEAAEFSIKAEPDNFETVSKNCTRDRPQSHTQTQKGNVYINFRNFLRMFSLYWPIT